MMERSCPGMSAAQLDRLVTEMARVQLRYDPFTAPSLADAYYVPRRHG